eukprot:m.42845 g.42845  ORF g.42845 m.42845 type:complete len:334 (+) comp6112_c0_seq1:230-1231(+)
MACPAKHGEHAERGAAARLRKALVTGAVVLATAEVDNAEEQDQTADASGDDDGHLVLVLFAASGAHIEVLARSRLDGCAIDVEGLHVERIKAEGAIAGSKCLARGALKAVATCSVDGAVAHVVVLDSDFLLAAVGKAKSRHHLRKAPRASGLVCPNIGGAASHEFGACGRRGRGRLRSGGRGRLRSGSRGRLGRARDRGSTARRGLGRVSGALKGHDDRDVLGIGVLREAHVVGGDKGKDRCVRGGIVGADRASWVRNRGGRDVVDRGEGLTLNSHGVVDKVDQHAGRIFRIVQLRGVDCGLGRRGVGWLRLGRRWCGHRGGGHWSHRGGGRL